MFFDNWRERAEEFHHQFKICFRAQTAFWIWTKCLFRKYNFRSHLKNSLINFTDGTTWRINWWTVGFDCPAIWKSRNRPNSRQTSAFGARSSERGSLDSAFRRSLAGFARTLSAIPNLPSAFPRMGQRRQIEKSVGNLRPGFTRARQVGFIGNFYWRNIRVR